MPARITCFWVEPTDFVQVVYRRYLPYARRGGCPTPRSPYDGHAAEVWGSHTVSVIVEAKRLRSTEDAGRRPTAIEKTDPRWPVSCECGYQFLPTDEWMINVSTLYKRSDTQDLVALTAPNAAPVGAMWNADWMIGHNPKPLPPDGMFIIVRTPAGDWNVDGPSSNNDRQGWTRTGTPPNLVVRPSIGFGEPQRMHGWLGGDDGKSPGVLVIDYP